MSGTVTANNGVGTPQPMPSRGKADSGKATAPGEPAPHRGIVGESAWDGPASPWFDGATHVVDSRHLVDGSTATGFVLGGAVAGGAVLGLGLLEASSSSRGTTDVRLGFRVMAGVAAAAVGSVVGLIAHSWHAHKVDEQQVDSGRHKHPERELPASKGVAARADDGPSALTRLVHLGGSGTDVTLVQDGDERDSSHDFNEALDEARTLLVQSQHAHDGVIAYAVVRDDGGFLRRSKSHVVALTPAPGAQAITATSGVTPTAIANGVQAVVTDSATYLRTGS